MLQLRECSRTLCLRAASPPCLSPGSATIAFPGIQGRPCKFSLVSCRSSPPTVGAALCSARTAPWRTCMRRCSRPAFGARRATPTCRPSASRCGAPLHHLIRPWFDSPQGLVSLRGAVKNQHPSAGQSRAGAVRLCSTPMCCKTGPKWPRNIRHFALISDSLRDEVKVQRAMPGRVQMQVSVVAPLQARHRQQLLVLRGSTPEMVDRPTYVVCACPKVAGARALRGSCHSGLYSRGHVWYASWFKPCQWRLICTVQQGKVCIGWTPT